MSVEFFPTKNKKSHCQNDIVPLRQTLEITQIPRNPKGTISYKESQTKYEISVHRRLQKRRDIYMIKVRTTAGRTCADRLVPGKTRQGLCIYCKDPSGVLPADLFPGAECLHDSLKLLSFRSKFRMVFHDKLSFTCCNSDFPNCMPVSFYAV